MKNLGPIQKSAIEIYARLLKKHINLLISIERQTTSNVDLEITWEKEKVHKPNEFGYYQSGDSQIATIYEFLIDFKLNSLIELGCGTGLIGNVLNNFYPNLSFKKDCFSYKGFENEQCLIDIGEKYFRSARNIENKDLLSLKKEDLMFANTVSFHKKSKPIKAKAVYMFEPFSNEKTAFKFNNLLIELMCKNQYLLYSSVSEDRIKKVNDHPSMKHIKSQNRISIFQKINN
ncbi:MAG: hypothetical protein EOL97_12635 [Spirochaetia bacterium]|nr:hypothetical protein [Spirochaetia bacterium]